MAYQVYTKPNCPNCLQAKMLLSRTGKTFEMIEIGKDCTVADLKALVPNATSVPQIFKNGVHIGGFKELKAALGD